MQRQIKSCTHCRQHKVRCDASKFYPKPCTRCSKFHLVCVVDQNFKPRKGGQVELLREHLAKIQEQIHSISKNSLTSADGQEEDLEDEEEADERNGTDETRDPSHKLQQKIKSKKRGTKLLDSPEDKKDPATQGLDYDITNLPSLKRIKLHNVDDPSKLKGDDDLDTGVKEIEASVAERMAAGGRLEPIPGPYELEDLVLEESKADELHNYFMKDCAPYIPIFESSSAGELYARSEFLFWAVMTTAALGESSADLYIALEEPMKRLAATKSLMATTRSSSVVQALLILSTWPLPSEKMLEDMSPRYASLAYSMGLQLGIHRGKFIYEFSRNQKLMPNAVKWRSRTWVQTYITQQMVSAASGIPPCMPVDYIIDHVLHDEVHPLSPRIAAFLKISMFYSKLVSIMGSRISTQDGLMDPESRCPTLDLLRTDLYTMFPPSTKYEDPVIEIMFLYARCIMDNFAFLPETPLSYQSGFIIDAFQASTRIVTLVRKLVGNRKVMEFPSFIRNPCNYAALTLFRLQSMPQIPEQYVASARESVVTVHHMYRNIPPSWLDTRVNNDISRIAKILESLNHVMMLYPELLRSRRVMRRMRSHLTFSLFYELLYIIHEARRRNAQKKSDENDPSKDGIEKTENSEASSKSKQVDNSSPDSWAEDSPANTGAMHQLINKESNQRNRDLNPLPLFNNIDRKSYVSSTVVSPNGTTVTKLVPANNEISGFKAEYTNQPASDHINGSSGSNGTSGTYQPPLPAAGRKDIDKNVGAQNKPGMESSYSHYSSGLPPAPLTNNLNHDHQHGHYPAYPHMMPGSTDPMAHLGPGIYPEGTDVNTGIQQIFDGLDWMNTEGDDFLGWMLPRNE